MGGGQPDRLGLVLSQLDLLILGGGGILYDKEARRYLRVVRVAQERGLPLLTYAVGVGPLSEMVDTGMVRETLAGAVQVTVRDQESRMVLEEAGLLNPITVTGDPAFLLEPEDFPAQFLREEGVPDGKRLVGMSVREPGRAAERLDVDGYHRLLAQIGDFLVHRIDAHVLFVPMERDDIRHSHGVLSHMIAAERGRILHGTYSPQQILGLMKHFDLAVGMRLHFLIFAAMMGTPFLPLPYAGKVFDLAQRLGVPALRGVEREVEGPLLAEVDQLWDEREQRARSPPSGWLGCATRPGAPLRSPGRCWRACATGPWSRSAPDRRGGRVRPPAPASSSATAAGRRRRTPTRRSPLPPAPVAPGDGGSAGAGRSGPVRR